MDSLGKKLDLLLYTGALLIKCLADSNRIDRNVRRAAMYMGIPQDKFNMHITYTSLILNINAGSRSITKLQKIHHHHANLNVHAQVSTLTWKVFQNEDIPLKEYEREILEIGKAVKIYPKWLTTVAVGLACGCFSRLFGADLAAVGITFTASAIAYTVRSFLTSRQFNHYMAVAIAAFIAAMIAILGKDFSTTPNHPLIASVLFLIPGIPLINSIDDLIDGFTMVGVTRIATATIIIGAISMGMLFAIWLLSFSSFQADTQPQGNIFAAVAAAIAACGFAILFNAPKRALLGCAIGGIIAVLIRNNLLLHVDMGLPLASFTAALCVGAATMYGVHVLHVPPPVLAVPSVIPMIPGVVMYDAMMGLIQLSTTTDYQQTELLVYTAQSGVTACLTILAISLGITIPNIVDRKYFSKK